MRYLYAKTLLSALLSLLLLNTAASADVVWGGQIRPRTEFRDPAAGNNNGFTSMRVRAQMTSRLDNDITTFIQLQDVRLWGEERNTLGDFSADSFDLHQGYIKIGKLAGSSASLTIGRQAISLGGQRLIGAVEWTQQGRAFDGVRLGVMPFWGTVDVIGIQLAEASSAQFTANAYLVGTYATLKKIPAGAVDLFALFNQASGAMETEQTTLGFRYVGKNDKVSYRAEGAFQTGTRAGADVRAFMAGVRAGTKVGKASLALWFDSLSGDDDPTDGEVKVFDTLFATNHKFYGFADLFLNIPVHTGGLGLQDVAFKGSLPVHKKANLAWQIHAFAAAEKGGLDSSRLGEEVDLTLTWKYRPKLAIIGGFSQVFAADGLKALGRLTDDLSFAYLMTNVSF